MTSQALSVGTPDRLDAELLALESESIHIIREVTAEFDRPGLLFSGGKDSIVMLHLAVKALRPARMPFPIVHIDTGRNFPEAIEYRDRVAEKLRVQLVVGSVPDAIESGRIPPSSDPAARETACRLRFCLMRFVTTSSEHFSVEHEGMRNARVRKSAFTRSVTSSASGTRRISVQRCGTSTTVS